MFNRVKHVGFDSECCGCTLRHTHGLQCAYQLVKYDSCVIPLDEVHIMGTRLSFSIIASPKSIELPIQEDTNLILHRFKEVDITRKVIIKYKLREIACPDLTSMVVPIHKMKTKGSQKNQSS